MSLHKIFPFVVLIIIIYSKNPIQQINKGCAVFKRKESFENFFQHANMNIFQINLTQNGIGKLFPSVPLHPKVKTFLFHLSLKKCTPINNKIAHQSFMTNTQIPFLLHKSTLSYDLRGACLPLCVSQFNWQVVLRGLS